MWFLFLTDIHLSVIKVNNFYFILAQLTVFRLFLKNQCYSALSSEMKRKYNKRVVAGKEGVNTCIGVVRLH